MFKRKGEEGSNQGDFPEGGIDIFKNTYEVNCL